MKSQLIAIRPIVEYIECFSTETMSFITMHNNKLFELYNQSIKQKKSDKNILVRNIYINDNWCVVREKVDANSLVVLWHTNSDEYMCTDMNSNIRYLSLKEIKARKDRFIDLKLIGKGLSANDYNIPYIDERNMKIIGCINYNIKAKLIQENQYKFSVDPFDNSVILEDIIQSNLNNRELIIPDFVSKLGKYTINTDNYNKAIIKLNNISQLNASQFMYNIKLEKVTIKNKLIIKDHVFTACRSLTDIEGTEYIIEIGDSAFEGTGILKFTAGEELRRIHSNAFSHSRIKEADLSKSTKLEVLEDGVFQNTYMNTLLLPKTIKAIMISGLPYGISSNKLLKDNPFLLNNDINFSTGLISNNDERLEILAALRKYKQQ